MWCQKLWKQRSLVHLVCSVVCSPPGADHMLITQRVICETVNQSFVSQIFWFVCTVYRNNARRKLKWITSPILYQNSIVNIIVTPDVCSLCHGSRAHRFHSSQFVCFHWLCCIVYLLRRSYRNLEPSAANMQGFYFCWMPELNATIQHWALTHTHW